MLDCRLIRENPHRVSFPRDSWGPRTLRRGNTHEPAPHEAWMLCCLGQRQRFGPKEQNFLHCVHITHSSLNWATGPPQTPSLPPFPKSVSSPGAPHAPDDLTLNPPGGRRAGSSLSLSLGPRHSRLPSRCCHSDVLPPSCGAGPGQCSRLALPALPSAEPARLPPGTAASAAGPDSARTHPFSGIRGPPPPPTRGEPHAAPRTTTQPHAGGCGREDSRT